MSEQTQNPQGRRATIGKAYDEEDKSNVARDLAKARVNLKGAAGNREQQKYYMNEVRYLTKKMAASR